MELTFLRQASGTFLRRLMSAVVHQRLPRNNKRENFVIYLFLIDRELSVYFSYLKNRKRNPTKKQFFLITLSTMKKCNNRVQFMYYTNHNKNPFYSNYSNCIVVRPNTTIRYLYMFWKTKTI